MTIFRIFKEVLDIITIFYIKDASNSFNYPKQAFGIFFHFQDVIYSRIKTLRIYFWYFLDII